MPNERCAPSDPLSIRCIELTVWVSETRSSPGIRRLAWGNGELGLFA